MNVLVTSISKKIPLLKALRNALSREGEKGCLYGADSDENCIGRYFCDDFWLMPPLEKLTSSEFADFCQSHAISALIPTRDGELLRFAGWADELEKSGLSIMVSAPDAIAVCLDKLSFYQKLNHFEGLKLCRCETDINLLPTVDRFVVKERFGSAAKSIAINVNRNEALEQAEKLENPVFQPFIAGREYSVDLYRSRRGINVGCVIRSRDLVVAGESQISTTLENVKIESVCSMAADILNLKGHAVFQGIVDDKGEFYLIECNPRFGGASTLGVAAGLDSFCWFLRECRGLVVTKKHFVKKGLLQLVRYPQDLIVEV